MRDMMEFESLRECTFQPNYEAKDFKTERILRSFRDPSDTRPAGPVGLYEKGKRWLEEKEQRLMHEREKANQEQSVEL